MAKHWTTKEGRVPGPGTWHQRESYRPRDPSLVARSQLALLVGVSNRNVVGRALEHLGIGPVDVGRAVTHHYNNGGTNGHDFDVPYFDAAVADQVRAELLQNSVDLGDGRFKYDNQTFRWKR